MLTVWIIVFTATTFWLLHDIRESQHDIQKARVESCQRTYSSFNEVFKPFFPSPSRQSKKQKEDLLKLKNTVVKLQRHCAEQTQVATN
jgi:hypothetical protein